MTNAELAPAILMLLTGALAGYFFRRRHEDPVAFHSAVALLFACAAMAALALVGLVAAVRLD